MFYVRITETRYDEMRYPEIVSFLIRLRGLVRFSSELLSNTVVAPRAHTALQHMAAVGIDGLLFLRRNSYRR